MTRDEESLVDGRIDRSSGLTRVGTDRGRVDASGGSFNRSVGADYRKSKLQLNKIWNEEKRERGNSHIDLSGLGLTGD